MGKREYADWKLDCVACGDDFWHREYAGTSKLFPDLCRACTQKQANGQRIEVPKPEARNAES